MTASKAAPAARAMILPLALAQFIASYAATNMNVAISAWFFLHVRSREKRGKDVLLPLRLFRNKIANLGLGTQTIQWLILQGSFSRSRSSGEPATVSSGTAPVGP